MIKLMFCVHRRPDIDEAEFHRYWLEEHGPLVASLAEVLGIARYVQAHGTAPALGAALAATRDAPEAFDGVAELWFESIDTLVAATSTLEGRAAGEELLRDERRFIDHARSPIFLTEEHRIV
jgi:uncharacterized protein (TIGR02118 family)